MSKEIDDRKNMEDGIAKLLGKKDYPASAAPPPCEHESDGYEYGRTTLYVILKCKRCGMHYEQQIRG